MTSNKKILICGDSFAADWTVKYSGQGWPNLLANDYTVTNLAQAGCSEYKILQQLKSVSLSKFDVIIVSHTSPYRLYVKEHPVHKNDKLHCNSDLIYTDLKEHAKSQRNIEPIIEYFEKYVDLDYQKFIHQLICREIKELLLSVTNQQLHLTSLEWDGLSKFPNMLNFKALFDNYRGLMNHHNDLGNQIIYEKVKKYIEKL